MGTKESEDHYSVLVSAGDLNRNGTVVSFFLPNNIEAGIYQMQHSSENPVLVQVDKYNKAWFILDNLAAGSSREYTFIADPIVDLSQNTHGIHLEFKDRTLSFHMGEKEILHYYYRDNIIPEGMDERYRRGGYIHPVYSPDGVRLTSHLSSITHPHHKGIWTAWTNTKFQGRSPDFWNVHRNSGRVDHMDSLDHAWHGPVHGGFRSRHHFVDLSASVPVIALNEQWEVYIYNTKNQNYLMFDLIMTHTTNTAQPLQLPVYHYGGMGFRGHEDWDQENTRFLTSEGLERSEGHHTRVRWCHIGGKSDGNLAGITIMNHPGNYRFPEPAYIHQNMPFFNYAPTKLGEMSIEPGAPYVAHYRYITYDGEPDPDELDRLWNDYAFPPGVTVKPDK